jgi:hypothetical protein
MQLRHTDDLKVPAARMVDLVTTESKDEVLVYDQAVHHIHHLNATAAKVWRLCNGERTVSEIAAEAGINVDAVKLALRTLEDAQLLDGPLPAAMRGTQSRRAFMKKAAVAGITVPAIVSISAPLASAQGSAPYTTDCVGSDRGDLCCRNVGCKNPGTCEPQTSQNPNNPTTVLVCT